jgi:hypothetical protein
MEIVGLIFDATSTRWAGILVTHAESRGGGAAAILESLRSIYPATGLLEELQSR